MLTQSNIQKIVAHSMTLSVDVDQLKVDQKVTYDFKTHNWRGEAVTYVCVSKFIPDNQWYNLIIDNKIVLMVYKRKGANGGIKNHYHVNLFIRDNKICHPMFMNALRKYEASDSYETIELIISDMIYYIMFINSQLITEDEKNIIKQLLVTTENIRHLLFAYNKPHIFVDDCGDRVEDIYPIVVEARKTYGKVHKLSKLLLSKH